MRFPGRVYTGRHQTLPDADEQAHPTCPKCEGAKVDRVLTCAVAKTGRKS